MPKLTMFIDKSKDMNSTLGELEFYPQADFGGQIGYMKISTFAPGWGGTPIIYRVNEIVEIFKEMGIKLDINNKYWDRDFQEQFSDHNVEIKGENIIKFVCAVETMGGMWYSGAPHEKGGEKLTSSQLLSDLKMPNKEKIIQETKEKLKQYFDKNPAKKVKPHEEEIFIPKKEEVSPTKKEKKSQPPTESSKIIEPIKKAPPKWLKETQEIKKIHEIYAVGIVGFNKNTFNEDQFLKTLTEMGISNLVVNKDKGYQVNYEGQKFIDMDLKKNEITSNDSSEKGFNHVAKLVKASGATGINMSKFIAQFKGSDEELNRILTNAYNGTKELGIELFGLGEKKSFIDSLKESRLQRPVL